MKTNISKINQKRSDFLQERGGGGEGESKKRNLNF